MRLTVFLLPVLFVLGFLSCTNKGAPQHDLQTKPRQALAYNQIPPADLGLSVKWARCNIGAMQLTDYGGYFAWGELADKRSYTLQNYFDPAYSITQINSGQTDVATECWGAGWRMPTIEEFNELFDSTKCQVFYDNRYNCIVIQGNKNVVLPNGEKGRDVIVLPFTGFCYDKNNELKGDEGFYWTSSICSEDRTSAYGVNVTITRGRIFKLAFPASRISGYAVRPVYDDKLNNKVVNP